MSQAAKAAAASSNLLIPLDLIDPPLRPVRHTVDEGANASLVSSIRALGVLSPVLVAPSADRYVLIAGDRRVRAAREVGLTEIPAVIAMRGDELFAQAAATAENIVRLGMPPVDQWRAIRAMQDLGYSLAEASACIGIAERHAQRLSRLGDLHPRILELIEDVGMPSTFQLQKIAMADHPTQFSALSAPGAIEMEGDDDITAVCWWRIAESCTIARVPRDRAAFDVAASGIMFDEDLFAEPGSEWQWTTDNVAAFIDAQRAWIEAKAEKAKHKVTIVPIRNGAPDVPKGYRVIEAAEGKRFARKHEVQFYSVVTEGQHIGKMQMVWAVDIKAEKAAAKADAKANAEPNRPPAPSDERHAASGDNTVAAEGIEHEIGAPDDVADEGDETPAPPDDEAPKRFTKAGLQLIADMKTEALRKALRDASDRPHIHQVCGALVLLLFADNVQVHGYDHATDRGGLELCSRLVTQTGHLIDDADEIVAVALEAIARSVTISGPTPRFNNSGWVAEVIGKVMMADLRLPRFDTPTVLAEATGETLRAVSEMLHMPTKGKSVAQLRDQIIEAAPSWMPHEAVFYQTSAEASHG